MNQLDILTKGVTLAVGDLRALLGWSVTMTKLREIELDAKILWNPELYSTQFLDQCKDDWLHHTGCQR